MTKIIEHLKNGGVIVYPTETAYAIGCDATNQKAVDLVFKLKKRAKSKTLPLIAGSLAMVKRYCQMSVVEEQLVKRYWPGAVTMVLKVLSSCFKNEKGFFGLPACRQAGAPQNDSCEAEKMAKGIVAKDGTVAVRVSGNKMARELSRGLGAPLVSTSANLAGEVECYSLEEVKRQFGCHSERSEESLVMFLDGGKLKKQKPSTIVKIIDGKMKILRQGEEILRVSCPMHTACLPCLPAGRRYAGAPQNDIMKKNFKIYPDKSRGQNFLTDKNVLQKIIDAGELRPVDIVLEIGAGTGVLTAELAKRVKKVIAFEIDKKLIPVLQENLKDFNNVEIRNENILECHPFTSFRAGSERNEGSLEFGKLKRDSCLPAGRLRLRLRMTNRWALKYKLISNIPYNITSAILEKFLSAEQPPEMIVLLVQKEVAERVCAKPRLCQCSSGQAGEMSVLSVMAQYYGEPKIIAKIPPSAFWPSPKVDSAILKIILHRHPELACLSGRQVSGSHEMLKPAPCLQAGRYRTGRQVRDDAGRFFPIVKAGFSQRRKMLKNNLRAFGDENKIAEAMREAGIAEKARAQELAVEQWVDLAKKFDTHL